MTLRVVLAALAALVLSAPALAAGGGGGGSSAPSASGPSYDPVQEYQSGVEYLTASEFEKAEKAFKRVLAVAKTDANTHYLLGLAHTAQDEWKPAEKAFKSALKYNPELHDARFRLAIGYLAAGEKAQADEQVASLMAAKTACAGTCATAAAIDAALAAIESAEVSGQWEDWLGSVTGAPSLAAADTAYLDAVRLINLGDYDTAKANLSAVLIVLGPHPDVLTYLGFANRKQGNGRVALAYYQAALAVDPRHINAREYLGEYHVERGDLAAARSQLAKIDELCPFGCSQRDELQRWIDGATG